eukprot:scaffold4171_cov126-Isochrysis_galbana.AAC.1
MAKSMAVNPKFRTVGTVSWSESDSYGLRPTANLRMPRLPRLPPCPLLSGSDAPVARPAVARRRSALVSNTGAYLPAVSCDAVGSPLLGTFPLTCSLYLSFYAACCMRTAFLPH